MSEQILKDLHLELVQGDDYKAADGRAVVLVGAGVRWPAAISSVKLLAYEPACGWVLTASPAILDVDGAYTAPTADDAAKVSFDLTRAITLPLARGVRRYDFDARATLPSGSVVTIGSGHITVT